MSSASIKSQCREMLQVTKLRRLRKQEEVLRRVLKKYKEGLHALQIEELTIKYELGKIRTHESDSQNQCLAPDLGDLHALTPADPGCSNSEAAAVNQQLVPLNIEATPLIKRMLHDSMAYDEEEDE